VLDGLSHVAVADLPADEISGNEPSVALESLRTSPRSPNHDPEGLFLGTSLP